VGKTCSKCKAGFYKSQSTADPVVTKCVKCDAACAECDSPGASGCSVCAAGYAKADGVEGAVCEEVDECAAEINPCDASSQAAVGKGLAAEFCKNTVGSYECAQCNAACDSAGGDGDGKGVCTGPAATDCTAGCTAG
jgi:hypothetical protein